ncbi:MAG: enolase [Methanomicrobiales archaeon]|nr:enolase [Methanomicrobiales archaeon]
MTDIELIRMRTILDSRGNPTVEAEVWTESGFGRAAAPSGASTGAYEAKARPAREAVEDAQARLIPSLIGEDAADQSRFDELLREMDGTPDFSSIGANVSTALSLANAKAAAMAMGLPLFTYLGGIFVTGTPLPLGNVIGGGAHAPGATEIQEFLVVPTGAADAREAVFANAAVHRRVKETLSARGVTCGKGDEGAWAPQIDDRTAFDVVREAVDAVSDDLKITVNMGIDVAASQLYADGRYRYRETERSTEEQIASMAELIDAYGLVYVEDPLREDDFAGFADLTRQVNDRCLVCGDDLFVTSTERIMTGIEAGSADCVLIKPNQVGTLTDTFEAVKLAHRHGLETVMSHRSGETNDDTIAHLATAFGCIFLKCGVVGGERTAKLNELIRIEEIL